MFITQNSSVVLSGLSFAWPDGTRVLDDITAAFGSGRTGLLGSNGTGKTTLLKLIAGELTPTTGTITVAGHVGYLPQHLALHTKATVAELLDIREKLDALRAIESGDADPRHFDTLDDAWDIDAHARATLDSIGLRSLDVDREVGTLSGGEAVLTALAGLRLAGDEVVLLDEPTNNLDRRARHDLYDAILAWRGTLIVVSHDVALLDLLDDTAELRTGLLTVFGGNYSAYRQHLAQEQAAAEQALRTAEQKVKTEERQRVEAQTKLARRQRYARTDFENKRKPKLIMNQRKTEAQVSAGKLRGELDEKVEIARHAAKQQTERIRRDAYISIDLPDPRVPVGRRLAELQDGRGMRIVVQGPERVALIGRNGVGKTRSLHTMIHSEEVAENRVRAIAHTDRIGTERERDWDAHLLRLSVHRRCVDARATDGGAAAADLRLHSSRSSIAVTHRCLVRASDVARSDRRHGGVDRSVAPHSGGGDRMPMQLTQPDVDDLPHVIEALRQWQYEGAPMQLHPGDLGWYWRFGATETSRAVRTWSDGKQILAIGLLDGPGLVRLTIAPHALRDEKLARQVVDDLTRPERGVLSAGRANVEVPSDAMVHGLLAEEGWDTDEPWTPLRRDLTAPVPDSGVRIEEVGQENAQTRVGVQRASFDASSFTAARWNAMATAPAYADARCLLAYDDRDNAVAAVTVWSAGVGKPGLIEPMGVHHRYRGQGYGRAITLAAAAKLRQLGSSSAIVCTPSANIGAVAAYRSAGMESRAEIHDRYRDG